MRTKKNSYIYWKASVEGEVDFVFLDIHKFVNSFHSEEQEYLRDIKTQLGVDIDKVYSFVLKTNREPVIYNGENDGEVVVSFGQIKMSFMSDKESIVEWLEKYDEYEIKFNF